MLKKQKLRNSEYYCMQGVFDKLHEEARNNRVFPSLMPLVLSENNILLAYRNIKSNKGSKTGGTDRRTICYYKTWTASKFISFFQDKLTNYTPKSIRQVPIREYARPYKTRILGIPCIEDRLVQQCILQVIEPICEAKFHNHSYGFRPNRSTSHAIARALNLLRNRFYYIVDVDIKGFFDNVNHDILLAKIRKLGIQDEKLIEIIQKALKAEIKGFGKSERGTAQGGIISPLLSNIVLNELDWWLSSQWETKKSRTKESDKFLFVRYADDFKIFCQNHETALKIFSKTKSWLKKELDLEVCPRKSRISNALKGNANFLGFSLFMKIRKDNKKLAPCSSISNKAKFQIKAKIKKQLNAIRHTFNRKEIAKLNSIILGVHNYYRISRLCSDDFSKISNTLFGEFIDLVKSSNQSNLKESSAFKKYYKNHCPKPRNIKGVAIYPISGCKYRKSKPFCDKTNAYTAIGRQLIHRELTDTKQLVRHLQGHKCYDKSIEFNDNRISLIACQNGECGVTGAPLVTSKMECHHKRQLGKNNDCFKNLVWLRTEVHSLIHATEKKIISKYLRLLQLDEQAFERVNSLRVSAGTEKISHDTYIRNYGLQQNKFTQIFNYAVGYCKNINNVLSKFLPQKSYSRQ